MRLTPCHFVLAVLLSASGISRATTFTEGSDAGNTAATSVTIPAGTTRIDGTLQNGTTNHFGADPVDVDVYRFSVSGTVTMNAIHVTAAFNTNILILREGFFGLEGQDGIGNDATLSIQLPPGTYYIAIGRESIAAFPAGAAVTNDDAWDNSTGQVPGPEQSIPIAFIGSNNANPDDTNGQPYSVFFDLGGATVAVTGLDQVAGKTLKNLKGADIVNHSGRRQTANVRGGNSGRFNVVTKNSGGSRKTLTTVRGNVSRLDFNVVAIGGGRKNVTAQLRSRGFKKTVPSGNTVRYKVSVRKGEGSSLRKKFLLRTADREDKSTQDTAGAILVLN